MRDPFKIEGPAVIQFSAGRSSGLMTEQILKAHNGKLPFNVLVCFENTGMEDYRSLDFVHACETYWNIPIVWLEYRSEKNFAIVNYETASRKGEPFDAIINDRQMLPNPVSPFCSSELKTRTVHRYVRFLGWDEWDTCVGLRADEEARLAMGRAKNGHPENQSETVIYPLAEAGITKYDVAKFWKGNAFDLALEHNSVGLAMHGNCVLCFKKGNRRKSLIRENPSRAIWWMEKEAQFENSPHITGNGKRFRIDREDYASMYRMALQHGELFPFEDEPLQDCMCTD
jgi:3'-phosphoadenosine 5'-phosphosulfate sulfotransferase (PAPS reductase)/FAD synthetase